MVVRWDGWVLLEHAHGRAKHTSVLGGEPQLEERVTVQVGEGSG